jgi:hypothetical protein
MYLDAIIAQYESLDLPPPMGCSDAEIYALEQRINHSLPAAYREFLRWAGHDASTIFTDLEDYTYAQLPAMQVLAHELLAAVQFPIPLPADAFVFHVYDSIQFAFIRTDDVADPTVYHFLETPSTLTATFTSNDPNIAPIQRHMSTKTGLPHRFIPEGSFSAWIGHYVEELAQEHDE